MQKVQCEEKWGIKDIGSWIKAAMALISLCYAEKKKGKNIKPTNDVA